MQNLYLKLSSLPRQSDFSPVLQKIVALRAVAQLVKEALTFCDWDELDAHKKTLKKLLKSSQFEESSDAVNDSLSSLKRLADHGDEGVIRLKKLAERFESLTVLTEAVYKLIQREPLSPSQWKSAPVLDPSYLIKDLILLPNLLEILDLDGDRGPEEALVALRSRWDAFETRATIVNARRVDIGSVEFVPKSSTHALRGKFVYNAGSVNASIKPDSQGEDADAVHVLHSQLNRYGLRCDFPGEYLVTFASSSDTDITAIFFSPDCGRYAMDPDRGISFDAFGKDTLFQKKPSEQELKMVEETSRVLAKFLSVPVDKVHFVPVVPSLLKPDEVGTFFAAVGKSVKG